MPNSKEVESAVSGQLVLYDTALWPSLLNQDPAEVSARFAERFKRADTIDALFDALRGTSSQDLVGRTIEVVSVAWAPYESDRGVIPNAIVTANDVHSGERFEFATTSEMLTLFIRRAELIGALPFKARITEVVTRNGQRALNFERP